MKMIRDLYQLYALIPRREIAGAIDEVWLISSSIVRREIRSLVRSSKDKEVSQNGYLGEHTSNSTVSRSSKHHARLAKCTHAFCGGD